MSSLVRRMMLNLAKRIASDPTRATVDDARKLSRFVVMMLEGK